MNFILITSDELRADCTGFGGNKHQPTPCLDSFALESVIFQRHFTQHGKCVPSRAAMLTGRHPHTDGHRAINHDCTIPDGTPNLHLALKNAGYETAFFGHNHTHENLLNGKNGPGQNIADYHSFSDDHFAALLEVSHPVPPQSYFPPPAADPCHETECITSTISGFCDENKAAQAIHYLRDVRDRSRPFYLHINFGNPHPPYRVEEPYFSMFDRTDVTTFPRQCPANAPLHLLAQRHCRGGDALDDAGARELLAVYLGMIAKVDALIGQVLEAVRAEGLMEETIILFTSDHGDFAGQYGLPEKWDTAMQDCILRVPFLLRAPGLSPAVFDGLSAHVDIPPTILDLLGLKPDPKWGIHGTSLVPPITGNEPEQNFVFAGGGHESSMIARFNAPLFHRFPDGRSVPATQGKQRTYADFPAAMARAQMVRSKHWKLVIRLEGGNELYHLTEDPYEMNNLYGEPGQEEITSTLLLALVRHALLTDSDRPFLNDVGA